MHRLIAAYACSRPERTGVQCRRAGPAASGASRASRRTDRGSEWQWTDSGAGWAAPPGDWWTDTRCPSCLWPLAFGHLGGSGGRTKARLAAAGERPGSAGRGAEGQRSRRQGAQRQRRRGAADLWWNADTSRAWPLVCSWQIPHSAMSGTSHHFIAVLGAGAWPAWPGRPSNELSRQIPRPRAFPLALTSSRGYPHGAHSQRPRHTATKRPDRFLRTLLDCIARERASERACERARSREREHTPRPNANEAMGAGGWGRTRRGPRTEDPSPAPRSDRLAPDRAKTVHLLAHPRALASSASSRPPAAFISTHHARPHLFLPTAAASLALPSTLPSAST